MKQNKKRMMKRMMNVKRKVKKMRAKRTMKKRKKKIHSSLQYVVTKVNIDLFHLQKVSEKNSPQTKHFVLSFLKSMYSTGMSTKKEHHPIRIQEVLIRV